MSNSDDVRVALNELRKGLDVISPNDDKSYINLSVPRVQLELVKEWIGSLNRVDSVINLKEEDKDEVAHAVQDFYKLLCDKLY